MLFREVRINIISIWFGFLISCGLLFSFATSTLADTSVWNGLGISPYQDYINEGEVSVNTKDLRLYAFTPIYTPKGRGIDFSLVKGFSTFIDNKYPLAISNNWFWDIPYLEYNYYYSQNILHLPGGLSYVVPSVIGIQKQYFYCDGKLFLANWQWVDSWWSLQNIEMEDGTIIRNRQSSDWYDQMIIDPHGNKIGYKFQDFNGTKRIIEISDSADRTYYFYYTTVEGKTVLDDVSFQSKVIFSREQTTKYITDQEVFNDAENRRTVYDYYTNTSNPQDPIALLKAITYPNGVKDSFLYLNGKVSNQTITGPNSPTRTIKYETGSFKDTYTNSTRTGTRVTFDGIKINKYFFNSNGYPENEEIATCSEKAVKITHYEYSAPFYSNYSVDGWGSYYSQTFRPIIVKTVLCKSDGSLGDSSNYATTTYEYDSWLNVTYIKDPLGTITRMAYANTNSPNYFAQFTTGVGHKQMVAKTTTITDSIHNLSQTNEIHYQYGSSYGDLLLERVVYRDPNRGISRNQDTVYHYDGYGNVTYKKDAKGGELWYQYDSTYKTYVKKIYKTNGAVIAQYDNYDYTLGKPKSYTDANSNLYIYGYDNIGRLKSEQLSTSDPNAAYTKTITYYDSENRVYQKIMNQTSQLQEGQTFCDSLSGKPHIVQRKLNGSWVNQKTTNYDSNGRVISEQDGMGRTTSYQYDPLDRVIKTTYPDLNFVSAQWDSHMVTKLDAKNDKREEYYDLLDRLVLLKEYPDKTNLSMIYQTKYVYDTANHLIQTTNPKGAITKYMYDNLGNLVRMDYPTDGTPQMAPIEYTYDPVGNLETKKQGNNLRTIEYDFFSAYRTGKVTNQPNGNIVNYTYDNNNNLLTQSWSENSDNYSYTYSNYDAQNRPRNFTAQFAGNAFNFSYVYDAFGRMTGITYPGRSSPVVYNYDELDRLTEIPGFVSTCVYNQDNKLFGMLYHSGVYNSWRYDSVNGRLINSTVINKTLILNLNYGYDQVGNITKINDDYYGYDQLNRLIWEGDQENQQSPLASGTVYNYDGAGNISRKDVYTNGQNQSSIVFSSDLINRLTTAGSTSMTYDTIGACLSKKVDNMNNWEYEYDSESRVKRVSKNGSTIEENAYDGSGMRIKKNKDGDTTYYIYKGASKLMEYSALTGYKYFILSGSSTIAEETGGAIKYFHSDHLGSNRVITDQNGNVIERINYKPFGSRDMDDSSLPDVDDGDLCDWTVTATHGTQFMSENSAVKIQHSTIPYGYDNISQSFAVLSSVQFDFDALIDSHSDNFSLIMASDGNDDNGGLWLGFKSGSVWDYYDNAWHLVFLKGYGPWRHYRIISTTDKIGVYVDGVLQYTRTGTFNARSFLKFVDSGLCSETIVNYIKNVSITPCSITYFNAFTDNSLSDWTINATHGAQFTTLNNMVKIVHSTTDYGSDSLTRNFLSIQNIEISFDATIGFTNNDSYSLAVGSDGTTGNGGLWLAFYKNTLKDYYSGVWHDVQTISFSVKNSYRIVSTRNKLRVYINDTLVYTRIGTFNPRSYLKFHDYGLCSGPVTNYIDNITIKEYTLDGWTLTQNNGTEFLPENETTRIIHSTVDYGCDSIAQTFPILQNVSIEFDAKIGRLNNDSYSLFLESDGKYNGSDGLWLAFNQDTLQENYNNVWHSICAVGFNGWNHFKVVSTKTVLGVYLNGILVYARKGSFKTRSYIKFGDYGLCSGQVTNFIKNVRVKSYTSGVITNTSSNGYRFTGKSMDEGTGLVYFGARWYDPELGRFISQDPAKQGLNWYVYCNNNPLKNVDPDGRCPIAANLIGGAIGASAGLIGYTVDTMLFGGTWNGRDAAIAAGVGGLAGFVAPWAGEFSGASAVVLQLGINGSANVVQYLATCAANGKSVTKEGVGWAVLSGFAAGAIGARDTVFTDVGASFSPKLLIANSKNGFSDFGTIFNKMKNNEIAMQAMKNVLSVNTIRSFLGSAVSNGEYTGWVDYLKQLYQEKTGAECGQK